MQTDFVDTSDAAKDHAQEVLDSGELQAGKHDVNVEVGEAQHAHHVLAGYKAAIKNPRTSDEAKEKAREYVESHEEDENDQPRAAHRTRASIQEDENLDIDLTGKDPKRVLQGFKNAIKNPRVSDAKREHAEKAIEALEQM